MNFLKHLFGAPAPRNISPQPTSSIETAIPLVRSREDRATTAYFETMAGMQGAVSERDFGKAARLVRENLSQIPQWIKETSSDYGSFDIGSVPALEQGGRVLALAGDHEGLAEMARIVATNPALEAWADQVEKHQKDAALFLAIQKVVAETPGCLQTDVKELIGETDGSNVAVLISYLEKAGKLARVKAGRTYKLLPAGSPEIPPSPPQVRASSHRTDKERPKLREIDISKLSYVPLPRSPPKWEEAQAGRERARIAEAVEHFEVRDADWQIVSVTKTPPSDRPDPAFRQTYASGSGVILIDDLGKAEGLGAVAAAAMRFDRQGRQSAKAGLDRDVYRVGVHPLGQGLVAMSQDCTLHAYSDDLHKIIETDLATSPEIEALRSRFEIRDRELKNHIRCVALSRDLTRYLFTAVDEAWCVSAEGRGLWGAKLPLKEGWTRVEASSDRYGTSEEVNQALDLMGLALPITAEELKGRYRQLAKQWHPDLNRDDASAEGKMKALTSAAEVLTGIESKSVAGYAGASFVQEIDRQDFEAVGMSFSATMSIQVSERFASDWIYAASFAAATNAVYLAGYSGRVVQVDDNGIGLRVYDIGCVPRQIVDTGDYLYMLTSTRLYVLKSDALHAVIDTFDGGELIVSANGFGLMEKKRLRWYHSGGDYIGSIVTKDPIRRVYWADDAMVVESRQRRAVICGVPNWWD
jgi:hypothetical protein